MASELAVHTRTRSLIVWQDPESRDLVPVGSLTADHGDRPWYRFSYRDDARERPGFRPLLAFPDLDTEYETEGGLFSFFANRVMSPRRPDYPQYVRALGLDAGEHDPIEILARSGGRRATDTIQVVEEPQPWPDGSERCLFLASGVRHVPGATERIQWLNPGQALALAPEPANEFNDQAVLLFDDETPVGYVPEFLLDRLYRRWRAGWSPSVSVEVANSPRAPAHLRLLCRLELKPPAEGR